jgi:hypothetical protein
MDNYLIVVDIYGIIYNLEQKIHYKNEQLRKGKKNKSILKSIKKLELKLDYCYEYLNYIENIQSNYSFIQPMKY